MHPFTNNIETYNMKNIISRIPQFQYDKRICTYKRNLFLELESIRLIMFIEISKEKQIESFLAKIIFQT